MSYRRCASKGAAQDGHAAQVHFVGIGGIGMSGIAEVLLNLGYRVSGSDLKAQRRSRAGSRRWARAIARRATRAQNVGDADVVVDLRPRSSTTTRGASRRAQRQIPVIPRAEMLAELMRLKYGVAVAGIARQDHHHLAGRHRAPRRAGSTRPRWSAAS